MVITAVDGTGGIGKTTFALHWVHRNQDRFPDGTLPVNLRGYGSGTPAAPTDGVSTYLYGPRRPADRADHRQRHPVVRPRPGRFHRRSCSTVRAPSCATTPTRPTAWPPRRRPPSGADEHHVHLRRRKPAEPDRPERECFIVCFSTVQSAIKSAVSATGNFIRAHSTTIGWVETWPAAVSMVTPLGWVATAAFVIGTVASVATTASSCYHQQRGGCALGSVVFSGVGTGLGDRANHLSPAQMRAAH